MKKLNFKIIILSILIPAFMVSCGGGESSSNDAKPAKSKAGKSEVLKMTSMVADYKAELEKIQNAAENAGDNVDAITKLATEYAEKEEKFNTDFQDYVSSNKDKLTIPVEQNIHTEFYELQAINIVSAKKLEHVFAEADVKVIKYPYPNKDNRIYLAFKDQDGQTVGDKTFIWKPNAPEGQTFKWEPRLYTSQLAGVEKAVVISEEEYKN